MKKQQRRFPGSGVGVEIVAVRKNVTACAWLLLSPSSKRKIASNIYSTSLSAVGLVSKLGILRPQTSSRAAAGRPWVGAGRQLTRK